MRPQTFFRALVNSFSRPAYYHDILEAPLSFSLRFAAVSSILLSILAAVIFYFRSVPVLTQWVTQNTTSLEEHYPQDLTLDWNGTQFATNQSPLKVPYPAGVEAESLPPSFMVIDNRDLSLEQAKTEYADYAVVISQTKGFVQNQAKQWQESQLSDILGDDSSFHITRDSVRQFISNLPVKAEGWLKTFTFVYPLFWLPIFILTRIISLTLNAVFIWIILRILSPEVKFGKLWQILLHCMIVAETAGLLAAIVYGSVPFSVSSLVFWAFFIVVFLQVRKNPLLLAENQPITDEPDQA